MRGSISECTKPMGKRLKKKSHGTKRMQKNIAAPCQDMIQAPVASREGVTVASDVASTYHVGGDPRNAETQIEGCGFPISVSQSAVFELHLQNTKHNTLGHQPAANASCLAPPTKYGLSVQLSCNTKPMRPFRRLHSHSENPRPMLELPTKRKRQGAAGTRGKPTAGPPPGAATSSRLRGRLMLPRSPPPLGQYESLAMP